MRGNRIFLTLFALLLAAPLVTQIFGLERLGSKKKASENRELAALPARPANWEELTVWPAALERFLDDHFGLRKPMIEINDRLHWTLFHETVSPKLLVGRKGRIFLDTPAKPFDSIEKGCGLGVAPEAPRKAAADLLKALDKFRPLQPRLVYLLVPTAPALYPDELPGWMQQRCAGSSRPADKIAEELGDRPDFFYPLALMRGLEEVIPKTNFHWEGLEARTVAEVVMREKMGVEPEVSVPGHPIRRASDLTRFNPGAGIENRLSLPDFEAAGIHVCRDSDCFPDLGPIGGILSNATHYTRDGGTPRRLLILSDSFGDGIAGFFAEGFTEVRHFSTNNYDRLDAGQRARFAQAIWQDYQPDQLLLLYHDGSALENPRALLQRFFPEGPIDHLESIHLED